MKFLVVGLGSMGKRRIRCLLALNQKKIAGFDLRLDRINEVRTKYSIETFNSFNSAINNFRPDVLIISTSPRFHMLYAHLSFKNNLPCFIEASVCNLSKIKELQKKNSIKKLNISPSCTMMFNDGIIKIKEIINRKLIGKVNYINYHVGQYLPDWHPWEKKGHYVWESDSNGCKELVPFELTWLSNLFGKVKVLNSVNIKLSELPINFNDLSRFSLLFSNKILADITIEVLSRPTSTRELVIVGSKGKIILSSDQKIVKFINTDMLKYKSFPINKGKIIKGYINSEKPYINEIKAFINSIKFPKKLKFPNSLSHDIRMLETMNKIIGKKISDGKK